jgi:membrane fusion protein (multidrug efflux system)
MFEDNVLERDGLVVEGVESPQSVPTSQEPSTASEKPVVTARARSPHESPAAKAPVSPVQAEAAQMQATSKGHRAGFLRRRPIVSAIGAMLLASAWTARDTFSPPTTPSSPRGNPRSPPKCRAT